MSPGKRNRNIDRKKARKRKKKPGLRSTLHRGAQCSRNCAPIFNGYRVQSPVNDTQSLIFTGAGIGGSGCHSSRVHCFCSCEFRLSGLYFGICSSRSLSAGQQCAQGSIQASAREHFLSVFWYSAFLFLPPLPTQLRYIRLLISNPLLLKFGFLIWSLLPYSDLAQHRGSPLRADLEPQDVTLVDLADKLEVGKLEGELASSREAAATSRTKEI